MGSCEAQAGIGTIVGAPLNHWRHAPANAAQGLVRLRGGCTLDRDAGVATGPSYFKE